MTGLPRVSVAYGPPADCRVCARSGPTLAYTEGETVTMACASCGSSDLAWPAESTPAGADGVPLVPGCLVESQQPRGAEPLGQSRMWRPWGVYLGVCLADAARTGDRGWLAVARVRELASGDPVQCAVIGLRVVEDGCPWTWHLHRT